MKHDFSIVFETDNELWQRVLEIFEINEKYPKKKTKGRELHHKFPRSFSKKLSEEVDNEADNLISLTPSDHFRVHYYYYLLAKKGFRQSMALAFQLMLRAPSKQISPATMEEMALDYEELRREAIVARTENIKKWREDNPEAEKIRCQHLKEAQNKPEVKLKKSIAMKGKNTGSNNGMYGKSTDWMTEEEIIRWKEAISKSSTGRVKSTEECQHISESKKGNKNPQFRRFSWKIEGNKFNNIILPEDIPDEEINECRKVLHFLIENHDWKRRLAALERLCEEMDKYNGEYSEG